MKAYAKGRLCRPTSYYAHHSQVDADVNRRNGLPALQGSEKQIAWAESIRRKHLKAASVYATSIGDSRVVDAVITCSGWTQAAHWIARRDASTESLLQEAMRNPEIGKKSPPGRRYAVQVA